MTYIDILDTFMIYIDLYTFMFYGDLFDTFMTYMDLLVIIMMLLLF